MLFEGWRTQFLGLQTRDCELLVLKKVRSLQQAVCSPEAWQRQFLEFQTRDRKLRTFSTVPRWGMPLTEHVESHFTAGDTVRDVVIGMADGLTVPFALAAGLSGAISSTSIVVTAGIAEIAAGSIAMGLGGYLAARSDAEHYESEFRREQEEVVTKPDAEKAEVAEVLLTFGLDADQAAPIVEALSKNPDAWVRFMMRFELGLEEPDPKRAPKSAGTIAISYIVGGLIPLSPYFCFSKASAALPWSVGVTLTALAAFGAVKGRFTGVSPIKSGFQTVAVGGLAAAAAFQIAKWVS